MKINKFIKKNHKKLIHGLISGVITLLAIISFILFFRHFINSSEKFIDLSFYYPKTSFKIPADVAQEMIASKSATSVRLPIIMYHYVEYADPLDHGRVLLSVPPSIFESQLRAIQKAGYQTVFARSIPNLISHNKSLKNPIALTFDDGYEDFYFQAFPLLKKYQMKGTIYVIYDFIGRKGYLNEAEIKELITSGLVELGSHTLDHAALAGLKPDIAWKEIYDTKQLLEKMFGVSVPSFAYPYGSFSKDTVAMVKKAGYTNAVSVIPGLTQSDQNDLFLFRIRPGYINTGNFIKGLEAFKN